VSLSKLLASTKTRALPVAFMTLVGFSAIHAQTLVSGAGVSVSVQDLQQDIERVPKELRIKTFSDPQAVQTNVSNTFVRRVLASEAVEQHLDQEPTVKAALDAARDRILSDARLAKIDATNIPSEEKMLAYARTSYKANTKRFDVPEEVRVRHILIRTGESEARAKTEQLLKELKNGANFEELAKKHSQDPGSAVNGGDLGFQQRGKMVKPFEDTAFNLASLGELSGVIETQFGFHILKLEEKRPAGIRDFELVKDTLLKEAKSKLINEGRLVEQERILSTAKINNEAIASFAKQLSQ
jgi:peptidyl-prolyl cis-trans isomerase C